MSRYGVRKFNDPGFVYGDSGGFSSLSVDPFSATAVDYDQVALSWLAPTGAYSQIRLVRNQSGISDTAEDGVILLDEKFAATVRDTRTFVDSYDQVPTYVSYVPLVPGQYAYYSIWLFLTNDHTWYQAGNAVTLIANRHETLLSTFDGSGVIGGRTRDTHEKVMDLLPRVFTSIAQSPTDEVDTSSALYNFLYGFSYTLDEFLTFIDLLAPHADMTNLPPSLLNTSSYEMSLSTDNRASTRFQRQLVREAKWLYARKGTDTALQTYVESMTGYGTTVKKSPNKMLAAQDSTFNDWQSYSQWLTAHSATITGIASADGTHVTFNAANTFVPGQHIRITGMTPSSYNTADAIVVAQSTLAGTFTVESSVTAAFTSGGSAQSNVYGGFTLWTTRGAITLSSENTVQPVSTELMAVDLTGTVKAVTTAANASMTLGNDFPITRGMPVTGGNSYALTFYAQGAAGTVTPSVTWYDINGVLISNTAGTAATMSTSWSRVVQFITAPSNAAYVGIDMTFSVAGTYWLDMVQLARGGQVTAGSGTGTAATYTCVNNFAVGDIVTVSGTTSSSGASLDISNAAVTAATGTQFTVGSAAVGTIGTPGTTVRTNIALNPRSETNSTGYVATGGTLTRVSTGAHSGTYAEQTVTQGSVLAEGLLYAPVATGSSLNNATISAGVWINAPAGATLYLAIRTTGASAIDSPHTVFTGTGAYQWVTVNGWHAQSDATSYQIHIRTTAIQAITFLTDDLTVELAATCPNSFSGSTANSGATVYAWTGTVDGSTSTATTTYAQGIGTYAFYEARGVNVLLAPNKQNMLTNPSFETASGGVIAGWSATGANLTQTAINTSNPGPLPQGTGNNLGTLTPTGGAVTLTGTGVQSADIQPGQFHVFSVFARNTSIADQFDATLSLTASAAGATSVTNSYVYSSVGTITGASTTGSQVTYLTNFTVPVGATVTISGATPASYNVTNALVTSTTPFGFTIQKPVSDPYVSGGQVTYGNANRISPDWRRFWVNVFIPANFGTGPITLTPTLTYTSTDTVQLDAAQLEVRYSPTDYMDGDVADSIWGLGQTNAHKSDSFMYQNWTYKVPRLADELELFLPSSTPYVLSRVDGVATTIGGAAIKGYAA